MFFSYVLGGEAVNNNNHQLFTGLMIEQMKYFDNSLQQSALITCVPTAMNFEVCV